MSGSPELERMSSGGYLSTRSLSSLFLEGGTSPSILPPHLQRESSEGSSPTHLAFGGHRDSIPRLNYKIPGMTIPFPSLGDMDLRGDLTFRASHVLRGNHLVTLVGNSAIKIFDIGNGTQNILPIPSPDPFPSKIFDIAKRSDYVLIVASETAVPGGIGGASRVGLDLIRMADFKVTPSVVIPNDFGCKAICEVALQTMGIAYSLPNREGKYGFEFVSTRDGVPTLIGVDHWQKAEVTRLIPFGEGNLLAGYEDGSACLLGLNGYKKLYQFHDKGKAIGDFAPYLHSSCVSVGADGSVILHDLVKNEVLRRVNLRSPQTKVIVTGPIIITGDDQGTVTILDGRERSPKIAEFDPIANLEGHRNPVTTLAFSSQGHVIVGRGSKMSLCTFLGEQRISPQSSQRRDSQVDMDSASDGSES